MSLRFTVLASGSGGNATLIESGDFGVLLDVGLGPRQLAQRLTDVGAAWAGVHAVLLTHTHGDHWRDATFSLMARKGVPVYCHPEHQQALLPDSPGFAALCEAGLVRDYDVASRLVLDAGLRCRPLAISHDGGPTFAFHFEGTLDLFGNAPTLAYAADLGCWTDELADRLANVDLLALEFNHDLELERTSNRSPHLIARVLGDRGHLSNGQAADLLRAVLSRSTEGRLRHVVQLHLSRDCNRPDLAYEAAQAVAPPGVAIVTADQDAPCPTLTVGQGSGPARPRRQVGRRRGPGQYQPMLPGLELTD